MKPTVPSVAAAIVTMALATLAGCDEQPTPPRVSAPRAAAPTRAPTPAPAQPIALPQSSQLPPPPPDVRVWWENATIRGRLKAVFGNSSGGINLDGTAAILDSNHGPGDGPGGFGWIGRQTAAAANVNVPLEIRLSCSGFTWGLYVRMPGLIDTGDLQMLSSVRKTPFQVVFPVCTGSREHNGTVWVTVTE